MKSGEKLSISIINIAFHVVCVSTYCHVKNNMNFLIRKLNHVLIGHVCKGKE